MNISLTDDLSNDSCQVCIYVMKVNMNGSCKPMIKYERASVYNNECMISIGDKHW